MRPPQAGVTVERVSPARDAGGAGATSARRGADLVPAVALLVATAAVFAPAVRFGLVWDDRWLVAAVESAGWLARELRLDAAATGYFRPVALATVALDARLAASGVHSWHATNIVLHLAAVVLVMALLLRLGGSRTAAALGAGVFALHPVHVEPVAFMAGRMDVLAAVFVLAAAVSFLRVRDGVGSRWEIAASLAAFAAACLSKEVAFVAPAVLLATEVIRGRRSGLAGWANGWAATLALVIALRWWAASVSPVGLGAVVPAAGDVATRLLAYARLAVAPWPLSAYYARPALGPGAFACAALLAALAVVARRTGLLAVAWLLVFLAPVVGVVTLVGAAVADRYLYLPLVGVSILCLALDRLRGRVRSAAIAAVALAVLGGAVLSAVRVPVWRDELTLFEDAARTSPTAVMLNNLGVAYVSAGRHDEALRSFLRAAELNPRFGDALRHAGFEYIRRGDDGSAARWLEMAVAVQPSDAEALLHLARIHAATPDPDRAAAALRRVMALAPGRIRALAARGDPVYCDLLANLARAYARLGHEAAALPWLELLVTAQPWNQEARRELERISPR